MGVLFGLRHAELLETAGADDVADGVLDDLGGIGDGQGQRLVILGGADIAERIDGLGTLESVKIGQIQGPGHLAGAVGTEVHENDAVALVDGAVLADHGGLHKFVGHALSIAVFHSLHRVHSLHALTADDGAISLLHAVPALVAVHAPEAALDGGDLRVAKGLALLIQFLHKAGAAGRRHVTAVQEAVDIDLLHAPLLGHIQDAEDVGDVAVHAAVGKQAHDVQGLAIGLGVLDGLDIDLVFKELAGLDLLGDLRQDLEHHAAGADVGVTHLGVAHLALRQTHVKAGSLQLGAGVLGKELVQIGLLGLGNGVACGGGRNAETVKNDKNGFFHK